MKIIWLPLSYVAIPWMLFLFGFKLLKLNTILNGSVGFKMLILLICIAISLFCTYEAFTTSIEGMSEKGIKSMTGAIVFPPIGIGCIVWVWSELFSKRNR